MHCGNNKVLYQHNISLQIANVPKQPIYNAIHVTKKWTNIWVYILCVCVLCVCVFFVFVLVCVRVCACACCVCVL